MTACRRTAGVEYIVEGSCQRTYSSAMIAVLEFSNSPIDVSTSECGCRDGVVGGLLSRLRVDEPGHSKICW